MSLRHLIPAILLLPIGLFAQDAGPGPTEALWLRQSAISPDGKTILFTYLGDLWKVDSKGGTAIPLTTHEAIDADPVWSRDGKYIAFSSDRHGNKDVYVMPSVGGAAQRLTFHSSNDTPSDFNLDGSSIIFSSSRLDDARNQQFPSPGLSELYSVPRTGGQALRIMDTPALQAHYNSDATSLVFHDWKGYEDDFRKHHTSSVTRDIWTYTPATRKYEQLSTFKGEDRDPIFAPDGRTVLYLSEESGSFNVHRMDASGGASTQLTFLTMHPIRYLSISADGTLCFSHHGSIHTMRPDGQPVKVDIRTSVDLAHNTTKTTKVTGDVSEFAVSSNGKEVAFIHRGEVFVTSVAEGTTRRITDTPEQERSVSFSPDGRRLLYATERDGSWDLYTSSIVRKEEPYFFNATVLKEEALLATPKEEFQATWSPDGREVAYLEERTTVRVFNLDTNESRTVLPGDRNYSYADGDQHFAWSPDGKWLLVQFLHREQWIDQAGLVSASGDGEVIDLSRSGYGHWNPEWIMDGKAMLTYSSRDGLKNHASWGGQLDAYATYFTQAEFDRSKLSKEEYDLLKEEEDKKKKEEKDKEEKAGKEKKEDDKEKKIDPLKIELDRIEDRRVRLTIHSSNLADAVLSKDGEKMFYLARFEKGYDLWQTELRTRETKVLVKLNANSAGGLVLDKEGKNLFFTKDGGIQRVEIEKSEAKSVGIDGEMTLDEAAERKYLFEHVWRQVVKKFYDPELHGVDWGRYRTEYEPMLPHIANNDDFADLLSEMLGELNASHTGSGFRQWEATADATASLGLFFGNSLNEGGLEIDQVLKKGPCVQEGSRIKAGIVLEKIDGVAITPQLDPAKLLNRKAEKPTLLSLYDPKSKQRWDETVRPISRGEESQLLYQRWVERCEFLVDSLSEGRIGYVHVRGMNDQSYRKVYDDALGKNHDKEALVVDTRFNGGGWLHDDLATFLSGKTYMRIEPRGQKLGSEPIGKWTKPSVVVMSESNYSDAHLFPVTYRALGVGKLVGMPVPGTGTAVWWESLQNGMYFGIPQVGMIDNDGNFMENTQLEPDVLQANEPGLVCRGRDQQLEAAVGELLEQLKK